MKTITRYLAFSTNFLDYILYPSYREPLADQPDNRTSMIVRQFLGEYPLLLGFLILTVGTLLLTEVTTGQDVYKSLIQRYRSSIGLLLIALPIAALIEEAIFRAILRLTPNKLRNMAVLLLWIPLGYYYHTLNEVANEPATFVPLLVWAVMVYLVSHYLKRPVVFASVDNFWQTNFRWIFYSITFLNASGQLIDDINTFTAWQLLLLPILLGVGLLGGFYFGYVRMRYGFWYAVGVHTLLIMTILVSEAIRNL